jgi:hypothetical protein
MFAVWVCWVIERGMERLKDRGNKGTRDVRRERERDRERERGLLR